MKGIKRGLYIIVFIISLFIINTNTKAFTNTHNIDYNFINENIILKVQENYPDFIQYDKFFCSVVSNDMYCRFIKSSDLNKINPNYRNNNLYLSKLEDFQYYNITLNKNLINMRVSLSSYSTTYYSPSDLAYTNIDDYKDYDVFIYLDSGIKELEINIKATNLLNFMLDKIKNIYEVLINNEIFKFILSIPLIYLVFLVLSRIIKK